MKSVKIVLILGLILALPNAHAEPKKDSNANNVEHCESIENKLYLYENDEQAYTALKHDALIKVVKKLYAQQLQTLPSAIYSYDTIVDKLTATIQIKSSKKHSGGLFTPCITLINPTITSLDTNRFKRINIAKVCGLNESELSSQEELLLQHFVERLKNTNAQTNTGLAQMLNDPIKIGLQSDQTLSQLIHKATEDNAQTDALSDMQCLDYYIYPVEIFVASS